MTTVTSISETALFYITYTLIFSLIVSIGLMLYAKYLNAEATTILDKIETYLKKKQLEINKSTGRVKDINNNIDSVAPITDEYNPMNDTIGVFLLRNFFERLLR